MTNKNYKIPFDVETLMKENGSLGTCSAAESIARNIMVLITTKQGENRFDDEYGNDVWNIEFDNAATTVEWEGIFVRSLKEQIEKYEPRIANPVIQVRTEYVEHTYDTKKYREIRKKAKIVINSVLIETGERFSFSTELFLSPMSVD